jgi:hypothetical protein
VCRAYCRCLFPLKHDTETLGAHFAEDYLSIGVDGNALAQYAQDGQPLDDAHQRRLTCWIKREGRWVVKFRQVTSAARPVHIPQ